MRTPTGCCARTFRRAPTSACTASTTSRPWRSPSTRDPARRWAGELRPKHWTRSSDQPIQAVLRRPLECALDARIGVGVVTCERTDTDRYGRVVALCRVFGEDLGAWMVGLGWALASRTYSTRYAPAEE